MKKPIACLAIAFGMFCHSFAQNYQPTAANLEGRKEFQDAKFGMFIHWGLSSVLGYGEWVATAKAGGMHYIVFITRHHDGFSNWDTKYSDWKITNTPYGKDVLKMLAAECKKQDMKLGLYYSTLDWYRSDYPYETGNQLSLYLGAESKIDKSIFV